MVDDSDEIVWRMVLAGDKRQYGTIWDRHRDRVFRHLIASGNTAGISEDLTAPTFLELAASPKRGEIRRWILLPWLIVTAQNISRTRRARNAATTGSSRPCLRHWSSPILQIGSLTSMRSG